MSTAAQSAALDFANESIVPGVHWGLSRDGQRYEFRGTGGHNGRTYYAWKRPDNGVVTIWTDRHGGNFFGNPTNDIVELCDPPAEPWRRFC